MKKKDVFYGFRAEKILMDFVRFQAEQQGITIADYIRSGLVRGYEAEFEAFRKSVKREGETIQLMLPKIL